MIKRKDGKQRRTPTERAAIMEKLKAMVAEGMTVKDASAKCGVHKTFWYSKHKKLSPSPKARLLTLPIPEDDKIMLIVGKASAVNQALASLAAIQR